MTFYGQAVSLDCSQPGCQTGLLNVDPRHVANLTSSGGWYCHLHDDDIRGRRMTREQLDLIPDDVLRYHSRGAVDLVAWLRARGWSMSLLELDQERQRRGITTPRKPPANDHHRPHNFADDQTATHQKEDRP